MHFYFYFILGVLVACWLPFEFIRFMAFRSYIRIKEKSLLGKKQLSEYLGAEVLRENNHGISESAIISQGAKVLDGRCDIFESILSKNRIIYLAILTALIFASGVILIIYKEVVVGVLCLAIVLVGIRVLQAGRATIKLQRRAVEVLKDFSRNASSS